MYQPTMATIGATKRDGEEDEQMDVNAVQKVERNFTWCVSYSQLHA